MDARVVRAALGLLVPEADVAWTVSAEDGRYRLSGRLPGGTQSLVHRRPGDLARHVLLVEFETDGRESGIAEASAFDTVEGVVMPRRVRLEGRDRTVIARAPTPLDQPGRPTHPVSAARGYEAIVRSWSRRGRHGFTFPACCRHSSPHASRLLPSLLVAAGPASAQSRAETERRLTSLRSQIEGVERQVRSARGEEASALRGVEAIEAEIQLREELVTGIEVRSGPSVARPRRCDGPSSGSRPRSVRQAIVPPPCTARLHPRPTQRTGARSGGRVGEPDAGARPLPPAVCEPPPRSGRANRDKDRRDAVSRADGSSVPRRDAARPPAGPGPADAARAATPRARNARSPRPPVPPRTA